MRWPLRYQILLPFAGAMLAVVVGVSLLEAYLAARRTQRQIEHQLNEVAQTLLEGSFPLTDTVLRQTRGLSGAEFVLTDGQGRVSASTLAGIDSAAIPLSPVTSGQIRLGNPIRLADGDYFHAAIALPPRAARTETAALHILYPRALLEDARREAAYPPLVLGSALLAVVVVLAIVIAARLSRPILELRRQLGRLVEGDFQPIALPARNDELRDLIGSVNLLAGQLDEMGRAIKRAERLALLGQLSGGLAHQLRNSATGARLAVQLHQRHCHELDQDSLEVALRQLAITEAHLVRFLTAGQPAMPRRAACSLRQIAAEAAALVEPSAKHRGVELRAPAANAEPCELLADAEQLRQLLLNLLLNAVEAAGKGGWVELALVPAARSGGEVTVRVLDSGVGPEAKIRDRLFEPFVTGKPEGIGLGLAVARQIAEAHGGTIGYIGSRPTCFEVRLPAAAVAAALADQQAGHLVPATAGENLPG